MEIIKKKVVRSNFYFNDIQDIFEYGEATFGEKASLIFFYDLIRITRQLFITSGMPAFSNQN